MAQAAQQRIILVTGANKGIGYQIVRTLLLDTNDRILLGARDEKRGKESVAKLQSEFPENKQRLSLELIDVADKASHVDLVKRLSSQFGKLDVVIHNAAIAGYDPPGVSENVVSTFPINYFGTFLLNDALLPLLRKSYQPRVIIVSSSVAQMAFSVSSDNMKKQLQSYESVAEVDNAARQFVEIAKKEGEQAFEVLKKAGYGNVDMGTGLFFFSYGCSKVFLNARVKVMKTLPEYQDMILEMVCPGYCATDLNNNSGYRTAEKGAETPAWLAVEDYDTLKKREGQYYWSDKEQVPYFTTEA